MGERWENGGIVFVKCFFDPLSSVAIEYCGQMLEAYSNTGRIQNMLRYEQSAYRLV